MSAEKLNTYTKYAPNVFVAKCPDKHEKGDEIILTTKYGKEHECIVHNFLGYAGTKDEPYYLYSITRADGFNSQERAQRKAEKLQGYAGNADTRSDQAYKRADLSEEATGIPFGQPILVGHHSERKHRRTIEKADNAMRKSIDERDKAEAYRQRAEYWESMANKIDLSMPESLGYFKHELEKAEAKHQGLKDGTIERRHYYSLTYAKKEVNELKKKVALAEKLWGDTAE